jgi:hypothetical protein
MGRQCAPHGRAQPLQLREHFLQLAAQTRMKRVQAINHMLTCFLRIDDVRKRLRFTLFFCNFAIFLLGRRGAASFHP